MFSLLLIFTAVQAYIIGGINGAIITSKYFYHKDIREYGSKNPGLTNFYRVFGKGGVALVVLIDALKTIAPVMIGRLLFWRFYDMGLFGSELAGLFVILGHCFPLFYGFKGGKGVMAIGTLIFFIEWRVALICWGAFILMVLLTRYVSLGSILGSMAYPISLALFGLGGVREVIIAFLSVALLVYRHKENIKRLINGTESKFSLSRKNKA